MGGNTLLSVEWFRAEPAFCVTFEADITNFRRKVKAQNLSFTLAFVYAVCVPLRGSIQNMWRRRERLPGIRRNILGAKVGLYCKSIKRAENAGRYFSVLFLWNAFFHLERKVFAEVIDMAADSLYNSY